jgi:hypothetical protein
MGKSPGGGLTNVFSSFLQDANNGFNNATLQQDRGFKVNTECRNQEEVTVIFNNCRKSVSFANFQHTSHSVFCNTITDTFGQ